MHTVGIYGLGYITLFGASCSTSEEEFEKTSKKKKKKKNRSKNKKTPIEPVVQEDNRSEGISCIDLLASYMFNSNGDNNSDLVSEENDDRKYFLLKIEYVSTMVVIT